MMFRTGVAFVLALGWTCAVVAAPEFKLSEMAPHQIDATAIDIRIEDASPKEYPEVGHRAAVTYEQATRQWAEQRFRLTGNSVNTLRVSLIEGRIVERILPIQKGVKGWFKKEQATEYRAALAITVALVDVGGKVIASADGKSWHTLTLVEGTTPPEKEAAWVEMISMTFENLDREFGAQLRRHFGEFVH
jgi:hypothetical protein